MQRAVAYEKEIELQSEGEEEEEEEDTPKKSTPRRKRNKQGKPLKTRSKSGEKKKPVVAESSKTKRKRNDNEQETRKKAKSVKESSECIEINDESGEICYISKAPFYDRPPAIIVKSINDSLSEIMHQEAAVEEMIYRTYARISTPSRDKLASDRILSLHLTGGSGIGKTRSAEKLAYALGIGPGTQYPNHYHRINLSKYSDPSHAVSVTGAASGLIGSNEANLVTKLREIAKVSSPFIILHLDEACKAHPAYVNGLNPLLSEGIIADVKEQSFSVPNETLFIILWTSNFGEGIKDPIGKPDEATSTVHKLMIEKGYDHCDIGRMGGDPIFFKPLTSDEMYNIIQKKGTSRLRLHNFSRRYGIPVYKQRAAPDTNIVDAKQPNILIRNILKTYRPELGVRHPLEKYKSELEALLTVGDLMTAFGPTTEGQKKKKKPTAKPPTYWCRQIKVTPEDRADPEAFLNANPAIASAISQNLKNRSHLKRILDDPTQIVLEYAVLKFRMDGYKMLAYNILQPISDQKLRADAVVAMDIDEKPNSSMKLTIDDNGDMFISQPPSSDAMTIIKLQNEVLQGQYDTLSKDVKTMKRQLDVLLINQRNSPPVYQTITTTTSLQTTA